MQKVSGFGGFFFRAREPKELSRWYLEHLGIDLVPESMDGAIWRQQEGPTVFQPFVNDTDYFGNDAKMWMLNFRVDDIDAMVAQLRAADIEVHMDDLAGEYAEIGRFARLNDPEGNPLELWEPA
ncbi:MAG: VOC family protein [Gammaproteobacteria bacterium TMED92]|nr:MAG: VOC family protein [Gammaproteobacteria bacterium TMED92]